MNSRACISLLDEALQFSDVFLVAEIVQHTHQIFDGFVLDYFFQVLSVVLLAPEEAYWVED